MTFVKISACLIAVPLAACSHQSMPESARTADHYASPATAQPVSGTDFEADETATRRDSAPIPEPAAPTAAAPASEAAAGIGAASPASARGGAYQAEQAKKAADRPGLGTTWGETRTSYVSNASFNRATLNDPFAIVAINYNNESGIQALARRLNNAYASFDQNGADDSDGEVSLRLLDESGTPLPSARFGGKEYVAGSDGQRYVIQIENHTGNRFEAVATVDGLDVLDGKGGSFSKRGYLVNPWATIEIDGFRRSESAVAAFRFGAVKDSYAARQGNARNVGVIGVAFFREAGSSPPWTQRELDRRDSANPFPGRFATPPSPIPMAR